MNHRIIEGAWGVDVDRSSFELSFGVQDVLTWIVENFLWTNRGLALVDAAWKGLLLG